MLYCSHCKYEYENEVSVCPDCGEQLVEAPIPIKDNHADIDQSAPGEWIPLAQFTSDQYSEMVVEALRDKEIKVILQSSTGYFGKSGQMGMSSFQAAGSGIVVLVEKNSVVEADLIGQAILGELWEKSKLFDISE